ncbi:hypothetical protein [Methanomassiliicoccus luminyensis]|jgi:hypothetical protein|uniref:hypothetical protein n=1 Tax=Methanomassiliicoccus luminyensis TaxID=1080712 RepID=UPI00036786CD|nr:hypothetical protein [Methanomassiliicoccus luminyensis]
MPHSTNPFLRQYNKTRLAVLACNNLGLILFLFGLSLSDYAPPLYIASMVILWAGAALSYKNYRLARGHGVEIAARLSGYVSVAEAAVLTVLAVLSLI